MLDQSYIFSIEDILLGSIWLVIVIVLGYIIRSFNSDKPEYKWFMPNLYFKLAMGLFFAYTYMFILGYGGDTVAYWKGANVLNNVFWQDPFAYINELVSTPQRSNGFTTSYNYSTGFPPGGIYYDPNSFFVSKIFSVFTFLTFKSYLGLTFICSFIASLASFRLFQLVRRYKFVKEFYIVIATLFIPSVAFSCSGVSKDFLIVSCFYFLLYNIFALFDPNRTFGIKNILLTVLFVFIIYNIRSFMLIAITTPLLLGFGWGYINKIKTKILNYILKGLVIVSVLITLFLIFNKGFIVEEYGDEYIDKLFVTQRDFAINKTYGEYRYDLGINDYSIQGMFKAAPIAIMTAFYRPFLWEANGAFMYINGIENLILMLLTIYFFFRSGGIIKNFAFIFNNEFLLFTITFTLFFGFFVGYSSGLFNVLIRFKAPIVPFLFLIFLSNRNFKQN